jgi:hypothetical protein
MEENRLYKIDFTKQTKSAGNFSGINGVKQKDLTC